MKKEIYKSPEYGRMLEWTYEVLDPYIKINLFPRYTNEYCSLSLLPGGAGHTRQIVGENTTLTEALREDDLSNFGSMIAVLIAHFGDQLWTPNNTRYASDRGKVYVVKHTVGGNVKYKW